MKDDLVQINDTVHKLNLTMTYNIISMWKWQLKSQMDQSLTMQDSLSGVEGEGETFKVCGQFPLLCFALLTCLYRECYWILAPIYLRSLS